MWDGIGEAKTFEKYSEGIIKEVKIFENSKFKK